VCTLNFSDTKVHADDSGNRRAIGTPITSLVIASDPQYPWTDKMDDAISHNSESEKEQRSEELIKAQFRSINEYTSQTPAQSSILINGDMTAYGHGWQWSKMYNLLGILKKPYYFGLGNHDIENNLNDTFRNQGVINSLRNLWNHVERKSNISGFDYSCNCSIYGSTYYGSYAYSVDFGQIHSIQLNNDPTWSFKFSEAYARDTYNLNSSLDWLEQDLKKAYKKGEISIVNLHKPSDWTN
ncbi:phosphoesterase, partial [Bacillus cereus]|uniref:metallophosphoesterase n=1 Tax=Bacillus cereus TaxID=1396 RepID=UPI000BF5F05D